MNTTDIIRVASAGGGLHIDCTNRLVADLVRIANAASVGGGYIYLENTTRLLVEDKVRIASAGKGHVVFMDVIR